MTLYTHAVPRSGSHHGICDIEFRKGEEMYWNLDRKETIAPAQVSTFEAEASGTKGRGEI